MSTTHEQHAPFDTDQASEETSEIEDMEQPSSWADAAMAAISGDLASDEQCEDVSVGWTTASLDEPIASEDALLVLTSTRLGFGRTTPSELPRWVPLSSVTNLDAIEGLGLPHIALELTAADVPTVYLGAESNFVDALVDALRRTAEQPAETQPSAAATAAPEAVVADAPEAPAAPFDAVSETNDDHEALIESESRPSPWATPSDPFGTTDEDEASYLEFEKTPKAPSDHLSPIVVDSPTPDDPAVDSAPLVDPDPLVCAEPVADMFAPADPVTADVAPADLADTAPVPTSIDDFRQVAEPSAFAAGELDGDLDSMESSLPSLDDTADADLPESMRLDSFDHGNLMSSGDNPPWLDSDMRWPRPLRGVQYLGGHPNHPRKRKNGLFGISPNGIDAEGAGFGDWSMNVQWAFINDITVVGADEATFNLGVRIGPKNSVISVEMDDGTVLNFEVRGKGPSTVRADLGSALSMPSAARQYRANHGMLPESVDE